MWNINICMFEGTIAFYASMPIAFTCDADGVCDKCGVLLATSSTCASSVGEMRRFSRLKENNYLHVASKITNFYVLKNRFYLSQTDCFRRGVYQTNCYTRF